MLKDDLYILAFFSRKFFKILGSYISVSIFKVFCRVTDVYTKTTQKTKVDIAIWFCFLEVACR